jgi:hypothetical protein
MWINFTNCKETIRSSDKQIQEIENLRSIVTQLTGIEDNENQSRFKRGIFDFIGKASKVLFGIMDNSDALYYTNKISVLEKEQIDFMKLSKEQMSVVKSTLRLSNMTLHDIYANEKLLSHGLETLVKHMNEQDAEIRKVLNDYSITVFVNERAAQLTRVLGECRRYYEILIEAILNAQKGILQPQVIAPNQILNELKASQADIPRDLSYPLPLSATYHHYVIRIIDISVFFKDRYLVYVIHVPLANNVRFDLYHVLPLPIKIRDKESNLETNKFVFILPEREYLLVDKAKRYYVRLHVFEFEKCKAMDVSRWLCKQNEPIHVKEANEVCETELLQSIRNIPESCSQRIVELNDTLWTQLDGNEWLYVAPRADTLTVLCSGQEPTNVEIYGTGKLEFHSFCKGYGRKIFFRLRQP